MAYRPIWKAHPQGLATLSTSVLVPLPSEASFSSQRSWASPFKALLLQGDRSNRSQSDLPFLRSPTKPPGLVPALQRLTPTSKAVPLFATQRFSPGRGLCSLGILGPPRLSLRKKPPESPLHLQDPLSLFQTKGLSTLNPASLRGFGLSRLGVSLVRAPACLTFPTQI